MIIEKKSNNYIGINKVGFPDFLILYAGQKKN